VRLPARTRPVPHVVSSGRCIGNLGVQFPTPGRFAFRLETRWLLGPGGPIDPKTSTRADPTQGSDAAIARERKINELQAEIQQAMVVRSTLEPALGIHALSGASRPEPVYWIVRRSGDNGVDQFDVDKFAAVMPGDIVEVIQSSRGGPAESNREPVVVGRGR
jgi:hypothetical protein